MDVPVRVRVRVRVRVQARARVRANPNPNQQTTTLTRCTGLPELLDELGVADALPKALAYCEAQGADSVELLREAGLGDELVESVREELPRAKALVLAKRLR